MGYWCKVDLVEAQLSGITPTYRSDEEFMDSYGLSKEFIRRIKAKLRKQLKDEDRTEQ